ncbi:MAG: amidohydrolase family protein [Acidobacteria bacterium]|nr:amidohydrolase family protein [Acidobacteriota bacterium]
MKKLGLYITMSLALLSASIACAESASVRLAWCDARIIDGTGRPAIENGTLVVRNGRIEAVGRNVKLPKGLHCTEGSEKTIIPGLISAHSHVNNASQLGIYLRDGITTLLSLGGDKEFGLRDQAANAAPGTVPRLYVAGPIQDSTAIPGAVAVHTPEEARKSVDGLLQHRPDIVKLRVDDFLGARPKMSPEVYSAIIDEAHKAGYRTAAHVVLLDDAKGVLRGGVDYIAHSVRDRQVDDEFISLMKKGSVFYCPTLTREVAVFTYSERPEFFDDPFFLRQADPAEIAKLEDPKNQEAVRKDASANWYREHLPIAMRNLKTISDAGIEIVMGTDSGGGPGRFQGYFEHLELEYETKAGLTPMQALISATRQPAKLLHISDRAGTLERGKWADFVVLNSNPLDDIRNTRKIDSVWIGGVRVPANAQ